MKGAERRVALGPFVILGAVVFGVAIGTTRPGNGIAALIASILLFSGVLIAPRWLHTPIAVLAFVVLSLALTARSMNGIKSSALSQAAIDGSSGILLGAVVGDPDASLFSTQVLVRVQGWIEAPKRHRDSAATRSEFGAGEFGASDLGSLPPGAIVRAVNRSVLVRASSDDVMRLRSLDAGDRVALSGHLSALEGFDTRWRWRHVVARLEDARLIDIARGRAPLLSTANWVRTFIARGGAGMPARERGVLAGFLLGDKRGIPKETLDTFRAAGMSHLLVVSGANVAAVLALVRPLLRRAPIASRLLIGGLALVIFGAATRWEPSVLRAIMMAVIVLAGETLGRPIAGVRVLCIAVSALLLLDPLLLHSVGFLLSAGATAGIALFAAPISRFMPGPRPVRDSLAVTAAAQIGVAPILIPVFGSIPLVALPANLLAAPLVVPVTIWGLVAGATGAVLGPDASRLLQAPTALALQWIERIAETSARTPGDIGGRGLLGLGVLLCAGFAIRMLLRLKKSYPPSENVLGTR